MFDFLKSFRGLEKELNTFMANYGSFATISKTRKDRHLIRDLKKLKEYAVYIKFNRALSEKDDKFVDEIIINCNKAAKILGVKI